MLIYGDRARDGEPISVLADLGARLDVAHDALVAAFITASELAQGIADAEHEQRGCDARSPTTDAAMELLVALARAIDASWSGRPPALDEIRARLGRLAAMQLPARVRMKCAEGYAYYALYPEAYLLAARRAPVAPDHVIGIRSIGCGLAALVAAATGAPLPATVRPLGDPFRRELRVAPALIAEWARDPRATIAIVDEGPGMSGSSFAAVADLLERHGIARDRLLCFPSHDGPLGSAASARNRARWSQVQRYVVTADELVRERLEEWLAGLVGPLEEPLVELSAGAWRRYRFARPSDWPPAFVQQERLKYLARTATGTWLARFVGLGDTGRRALELARATSSAGFTPEVVGSCHGFLVERWLGDATTLDVRTVDRAKLVDRVGAYLAFRAEHEGEAGASGDELIAMVRRNVTLGIGEDVALQVVPRGVPAGLVPVAIDGKLHAWEWLVQADGTLIKADAYDHHASHDLIGCQDIAWDVVGASVELELSPDEQDRLVAIAGARREHVAFMWPCYLAFQLGRAKLAAQASDGEEAARLEACADRYARLLASRSWVPQVARPTSRC